MQIRNGKSFSKFCTSLVLQPLTQVSIFVIFTFMSLRLFVKSVITRGAFYDDMIFHESV